MKRRVMVCVIAVLILVISVPTYGIINYLTVDDLFYVGVTYCGNNISDAKLLIDKVKDCTNLFVLQSGNLQTENASINEIGDYAINSGLNFIVYMGVSSFALANNWLSGYDGRWGNHFLGVYLADEPGGKMLEGRNYLYDPTTDRSITKTEDGMIANINNKAVTYMRNGTVGIEFWDSSKFQFLTYYPNGTVASKKDYNSPLVNVNDPSSLTYSYDQLWKECPIQTYSDAARFFVGASNNTIGIVRNDYNSSFKVLTSDYALHWFDYQSGYDTVLAEFCWNESITRDIALVRGAANAFGKDWGATITWQYTTPPYLPNGNEMYQRMCAAYENGAKYVVVFNYAPDMQGPYGTLTEDHFQALQRFWTEEVNNAGVIRGQTKADTAFVLPKDFGSGLRNQQDIVWGLWSPSPENQTIWPKIQDAISTYGQKLDIVYDDPAYQVAGRYQQIIYWNQTK
jgi:hypothetical protein